MNYYGYQVTLSVPWETTTSAVNPELETIPETLDFDVYYVVLSEAGHCHRIEMWSHSVGQQLTI